MPGPPPAGRRIARRSRLLNEMYAAYTLEFLRVSREHDRAPLEFAPYDAPPDDRGPVVAEPGLVPDLRANPLPG